jgi:8-oxo-dGTP diphosphatase
MVDRSSAARAATHAVSIAVDVVVFTPHGRELAVLLAPATVPAAVGAPGAATALSAGRSRPRERLGLPSDTLGIDEGLNEAAMRIARRALAQAPTFLDQVGASGANRRTAEGADVVVTYFAAVAESSTAEGGESWVPLSELGPMPRRQREEVDWALATMRARMDQQPIAFRLLPPTFTLSELQAVYELLLGHRLHKASFRRSLHAAALVEATDEWRSEGRGRPAQLFRYAPPRRRRARRGVRFDLLG